MVNTDPQATTVQHVALGDEIGVFMDGLNRPPAYRLAYAALADAAAVVRRLSGVN